MVATNIWYFEHDKLICKKCNKPYKKPSRMNFYIGSSNGKDAHKFECTNKKCKYVEIKILETSEGEI